MTKREQLKAEYKNRVNSVRNFITQEDFAGEKSRKNLIKLLDEIEENGTKILNYSNKIRG